MYEIKLAIYNWIKIKSILWETETYNITVCKIKLLMKQQQSTITTTTTNNLYNNNQLIN